MQSKYDNVLVFGATGEVGGHTAVAAHAQGANVWMAMRDPGKKVRADIAAEEKEGGSGRYHRIKADLSDSDSITSALKESKAKAAFIYVAHGTDPHKTAEGLKKGGVEYVVFLSSFGLELEGPKRSITRDSPIAYSHAGVEIALEDAQIPFTAVRPGFFASNPLNQEVPNKDGSKDTGTIEVPTFTPQKKFDFIAPVDIGLVAAKFLVHPPPNLTASKPLTVPLLGPKLLTRPESWDIVNGVLGRERYAVREIGEAEFRRNCPPSFPAAFVDFFVKLYASQEQRWSDEQMEAAHKNMVENLGREPTSFKEYVEQNSARYE